MLTGFTGNSINAQVRHVTSKAVLYNGSTLVKTFNHTDQLKSIDIERVGESGKFFGFGICQKANIKLIDKARALNITTANRFKAYFKTTETSQKEIYPTFHVTEVHRDENNNELSITAYDFIKEADKHTISEIDLTFPYTVRQLAYKIAVFIGCSGMSIANVPSSETCFDTSYPEGANIDGAESLREILNAIAEVTQTVYFINYNNVLIFKRLSTGDAVLTIDKSQYFTLESSTNRRLAAITHETELGDNLTANSGMTGTTQIIRNNPFWELRDDLVTLLNNSLAAVGGMTINQFNCKWRGNYTLEIGDKIALVTKDNNTVTSYVLNDVISYAGDFTEVTQWSYTSSDSGNDSNSVTLGEALKQTYAKVDKVKKEITILASDVSTDKELLASILVTLDSITNTVSNAEKVTTDALSGMENEIAELTKSVETKITAEEYEILVKETLSNGVDKVETSTGVKVDKDGLTVSKSDNELATTISHDGMKVRKNNEDMLTADSSGVNAKNLHATTYLIIGNNSRFEDYGQRTGCFWIGG